MYPRETREPARDIEFYPELRALGVFSQDSPVVGVAIGPGQVQICL
jgi:hypothetical protein